MNTVHVAVFPLVERAKQFAEKIAEPGWWVRDIVQKGRTVTFTDDVPADAGTTDWEHFGSMLETVGFFGSDQKRKATLDGVKAPISY